MQRTRISLVAGIWVSLLCAHPMGNFSVNHYTRIAPHDGGADLTYVLDVGEIATLALLDKWQLQAASAGAELESHAEQEARGWLRNLQLTIDDSKVEPQFLSSHATLSDGAGGMKVIRIETKASIKGSGMLGYEDRNYADKEGWKELVVGTGPDKSHALTSYPADPAIPKPQDLRATIDLTGHTPPVVSHIEPPPTSGAPTDGAAPVVEPARGQAEPGKARDYLSTVLHGGEITFGVGLICLAVAFGLGALHAFEPGHGKTMVAAYLVGSRGTPRHAVLLGLMTTFTHTVSVFLLGFVTIFLSRYIMPEKMTKILGILSGLSIVWIGALMLFRRSQKLMGHSHGNHGHSHGPHSHDHAHDHDHRHARFHGHGRSPEHNHHHVPEEITMGSLIALGASGGMVPCPAALILLLTCISLGRPGFGMMLLLSFSVGLAIVLMATGLIVLYAKNLVPERHRNSESGFMRAMPVVSAAIIVVIGVVMTGVSLGWLPANRFFG